jgi:hypothetical protein
MVAEESRKDGSTPVAPTHTPGTSGDNPPGTSARNPPGTSTDNPHSAHTLPPSQLPPSQLPPSHLPPTYASQLASIGSSDPEGYAASISSIASIGSITSTLSTLPDNTPTVIDAPAVMKLIGTATSAAAGTYLLGILFIVIALSDSIPWATTDYTMEMGTASIQFASRYYLNRNEVDEKSTHVRGGSKVNGRK